LDDIVEGLELRVYALAGGKPYFSDPSPYRHEPLIALLGVPVRNNGRRADEDPSATEVIPEYDIDLYPVDIGPVGVTGKGPDIESYESGKSALPLGGEHE
jgi:hypothetical protein